MIRLRERYRALPVALRAGIWFAVLQYTQQALAVLTTPLFTRILTTEQYGLVSVYNTWHAVLDILFTLRLSAGIYQIQLSEHPDDRENVTSSLTVLSSFLLLGVSAIFLIFRAPLASLLKLPVNMMLIMLLDIWAQMVLAFWLTRNRFEYRYRLCLSVVLLNCLLRTGCSVTMTLLAPENPAFYKVLGNAIPETAVSLVLLAIILRRGRFCLKRSYWKEALAFNIVLMPSYLSSVLLSSSDRLMIRYLRGESEVALYSLAYSCAHLTQLSFSAINWAFTPFAYSCMRRRDYASLRRVANLLTVFTALFTALLVCFAPEAIALLAPKQYRNALQVIPPAACGIFLTFVYSFFAHTQNFYKKKWDILLATVAGAVVNIILNWIFIPRFGYLAAAYTTVAGYAVTALLRFWRYRRIIPEPIYNVRMFLLISLLLFAFGAVCAVLYPYPVIRYFMIAGIVLVLILRRDSIRQTLRTMRENADSEAPSRDEPQ